MTQTFTHQAGPTNEPLGDQIRRLGEYLMERYPSEIGRGYPDGTNQGEEGAIDVAIRLLNGGTNPAPDRQGQAFCVVCEKPLDKPIGLGELIAHEPCDRFVKTAVTEASQRASGGHQAYPGMPGFTDMIVYHGDDLESVMERIGIVAGGSDMVGCHAHEDGHWVLQFVERPRV